MILFVFFLIVLSFIGIKINKRNYYTNYIEKTECNSIKGFFIIIVFLRHITSYLKKNGYESQGILDNIYFVLDSFIGQLLVVMFLFYSGYGIMESFKKKGEKYFESYPKKRILVTFLNFDIAVCFFGLVDLLLDIPISISDFVFSLFAWSSVGNSNWYIFVILCCYIITYASYYISSKRFHIKNILFAIILLMIVLSIFKEEHWYNTILCFPVGMYYSMYKNKIEEFTRKYYFIVVSLLFIFFSITFIYNYYEVAQLWGISYNLESIIFALLVVSITMKIKIDNVALVWLGENLFSLYIYQRLPMIFINSVVGADWICEHAYFYVIICLVITLAISYLYRNWRISL